MTGLQVPFICLSLSAVTGTGAFLNWDGARGMGMASQTAGKLDIFCQGEGSGVGNYLHW